ncbi:BQ2448_2314 [Microbotryum intermedium]|uniref:BQ2448_2314 protein n=1 Tax=Microbotryum intermedium TaxID=269621 RepID=A0A238FBL4_9BASI|nr:BQ2448_2314 [Microbotryum intermedium]
MYGAGRLSADGAFKRGHTKAASSFGGWSNAVPPLNVPDTLALHLQFALRGCQDALQVAVILEKLSMDKVVASNVVKSSVMQGVVLLSALAIKPLVRSIFGAQSGGSTFVYIMFLGLWLYPIALAATYYSGLLRPSLETDRRGASRMGLIENRGLTARMAAESHRALVMINYFLVAFVLRRVPWVGPPVAFLYSCIVDSWYCWEQQMVRSKWPFAERVKQLDSRWAYHLGFGFPITLLSWWSAEPIVTLAIFSLFYPFFQVMATASIAQPLDVSIPASAINISFMPKGQGSFSMAAAEGGEENRGRRGHPFVPVRIRVLAAAEVVHGALLSSFGGGRKKDAAASNAATSKGSSASRNRYGDHSSMPSSPGTSSHFGRSSDYSYNPYGEPAPSGDLAWRQGEEHYGPPPRGPPPCQDNHSFVHAKHAASRRGHVNSDSTVGNEPAYGATTKPTRDITHVSPARTDHALDSLLRSAAGRKKGD